MTIKIYKCLRCGHEWAAKRSDKPKPLTCSKCRSPYWDTEKRVRKVGKETNKRTKKEADSNEPL